MLQQFFHFVLPADEAKSHAHGYLIQKKVILRKWFAHRESFLGNPVFQVVVPLKLHNLIMHVSLDVSGHMNVKGYCVLYQNVPYLSINE